MFQRGASRGGVNRDPGSLATYSCWERFFQHGDVSKIHNSNKSPQPPLNRQERVRVGSQKIRLPVVRQEKVCRCERACSEYLIHRATFFAFEPGKQGKAGGISAS